MSAFHFGPFIFEPGATHRAGAAKRRWAMFYGNEEQGWRTLPAGAAQAEVIEAFDEARAAFVKQTRAEHAPERIDLVDFESGDAIAHFYSYSACGMTPGLIDDRARYWIRSADRKYSRNLRALSEFAETAASHAAPPASWIGGLLPNDVMTNDSAEWRPPTSWEIRHIVGEGSFTGISGARAAALIGVTPQNFRKYTARDGASTRQNMSFAMWNLLLHKLGVKHA